MLNKRPLSRITVLESAKNSICEEVHINVFSWSALVFYWPGMISSSGTALCSSLMLSSNVLFHCCFVSNSHAVTLWWSDLLEPVLHPPRSVSMVPSGWFSSKSYPVRSNIPESLWAPCVCRLSRIIEKFISST